MTDPEINQDSDTLPLGVGALVALSILAFAAGLGIVFFHAGVGLVVLGASGILAIWARIAQAGIHQEQTLAEIRRLNVPRGAASEVDQAAERMSEREWAGREADPTSAALSERSRESEERS